MTITRRRFLTIASAACMAGVTPAYGYRWEGMALGARAQILLDHPKAEDLTRVAIAEIDRLEGIFSLYRRDSELMRLNHAGQLEAPSFEFLECLSIATRVHRVTKGRFDPTVQPLWAALAEAHATGQKPDPDRIAGARAAIGLDRIRLDAARIILDPGQGLTLNGIAQGYIADRVAYRLQDHGVTDVLIDTGEILALGHRNGAPWPVKISGDPQERLLTGRALASSDNYGTVFDHKGQQGHILDPLQGQNPPAARRISISAESAALADGLSTGLCLMPDARAVRQALSKVKDAHLENLIERRKPLN
ncbi:MAG: FAD:protein FMN transferase [Pseudorhodobacter sp.]